MVVVVTAVRGAVMEFVGFRGVARVRDGGESIQE